MGARLIRRKNRQADMAKSRTVNGHRKRKEQARRDLRMLELLDKGQLPYTPPVMTWLSEQAGKPAKELTADDVTAVKRQHATS